MSTTTRQQASAARKDQIIRAAVVLLAERGYHATTFDAICQQAGLSSKRLITYHFSNKDDLLTAIAENVVADAEAFMRPALDAATAPRELLAAVIRTNVAFMAGHPEQIRALQQIILNGGDGWAPHHAESIDRLARLLADGQRTGAFRPCNPHVMAAALRGALDSMSTPLSTGLDPGQCAEELVELFDRATRCAADDEPHARLADAQP